MNSREAQHTDISNKEARMLLESFIETQRNRRSAFKGKRIPPPHAEYVLDWLADVIGTALSDPRARGPLRFVNPPHRQSRDIPPSRVARLVLERMWKGAIMKAAVPDVATKLKISVRQAERHLASWRADNPVLSRQIDQLQRENRLGQRTPPPG